MQDIVSDMNGNPQRSGISWSARLLIALALILAGAAAAVWGLARSEKAARFLGIAAAPPAVAPVRAMAVPATAVQPVALPSDSRVAELESRLARVENATQRAEGSAGRADALVVAFAARRAIDRGVALGYLEGLLVARFGAQNPQAVGTIVSASHQRIRLNDLIAEYATLGPDLRRGGPQDSWWTNFKRGFGSLVEVHRAGRPPQNADARYARALERLSAGDVDQALAETMRLPGATRAQNWAAKARRYVAAHRALDEIESAALLGGQQQR
jgi:hypothetical protein